MSYGLCGVKYQTISHGWVLSKCQRKLFQMVHLREKNISILTPSEYHLQKNDINPYPTAFPYGNGMVLHFYQQQESSTTKTVHKVINKGLKTYV